MNDAVSMAEWIKLQWEFGKAVPAEVSACAHRTLHPTEESVKRWLFQANSDWTESQLTEVGPEHGNDHDTNGKPYSFKHVFEAVDWDEAKLQIARLRWGPDQ